MARLDYQQLSLKAIAYAMVFFIYIKTAILHYEYKTAHSMETVSREHCVRFEDDDCFRIKPSESEGGRSEKDWT